MPFFKLNDVFAGRYVLVELIGEGDSSEVWKARNQLADEIVVVLKIYTPEHGLDEDGVRQFRKEFTLLQQLYHPHLLKAYHFDVWEGNAYLIMPFSPGGSLAGLLSEESSFSEKQVALVLSQIGSALAALHAQDPPILHRDVKPENIVVSQPDYFLLANFGISSRSRHPSSRTAANAGSDIEIYAPPESYDRYQKNDASADIFALGVSLFEMCTRKIPWKGTGSQILLTGGSVPNLLDHYSTDLNQLLHACMSAERSERPDAEELHQRGKNFLETGSWALPLEENVNAKSYKNVIPYFLAAAGFAILLIGVYWAYFNNHLAIPAKRLQHMASPVDQEQGQDQDIDQMIIATLEDELEDMKRRTLELEEENKQLKGKDSASSTLMRSREAIIEERPEQPEQSVKKDPEPIIEEPRDQVAQNSPAPLINKRDRQEARKAQTSTVNNEETKSVASTAAAPPKEDNSVSYQKELEQHLNKISDPSIPNKERTAWKQETMAQFSESGIRIVDETEGTPRQYSASIFLNLLSKVPHTIVVKEVKRDQNKKVTELRLTMESNR